MTDAIAPHKIANHGKPLKCPRCRSTVYREPRPGRPGVEIIRAVCTETHGDCSWAQLIEVDDQGARTVQDRTLQPRHTHGDLDAAEKATSGGGGRPQCLVPSCQRLAVEGGFCDAHFAAWKRAGKPQARKEWAQIQDRQAHPRSSSQTQDQAKESAMASQCRVEGCQRSIVSNTSSLCDKHHQRWTGCNKPPIEDFLRHGAPTPRQWRQRDRRAVEPASEDYGAADAISPTTHADPANGDYAAGVATAGTGEASADYEPDGAIERASSAGEASAHSGAGDFIDDISSAGEASDNSGAIDATRSGSEAKSDYGAADPTIETAPAEPATEHYGADRARTPSTEGAARSADSSPAITMPATVRDANPYDPAQEGASWRLFEEARAELEAKGGASQGKTQQQRSDLQGQLQAGYEQLRHGGVMSLAPLAIQTIQDANRLLEAGHIDCGDWRTVVVTALQVAEPVSRREQAHG